MFVRVLLVALLSLSVLHAQTARPRKVFISVDMEGISGVVQPAQLGPDGFEYQRAREWMTGEVNAAIAGIREAGPAEIIVADSHGNAQSLLIDKLPDDVRTVRGFPRPLEMMQGIDDSFSAAVFIGYHASEWTPNAVRGHTISSARLLGIKLNGTEVSEGMYNAALAGQFGVPVAFVSGDRLAVTQLQQVAPAAEGAIVKEPYGYHSALTVTPARGQAMIREGLKRAMGKLASGVLTPYRVTAPIALEVGFKLTIDAERAAFVPGLTRSDAHSVKGTFRDMTEITRLLQVLTSLELP
ncbi:MAG TPA: M55 family metallopeptidase [Vicinamibacterales bacterium]|nr:M55 family metallopeptidase [Vicinamibacterales bacterium]